MDLPPPSQSQAPKSTLFSNADGTPIRVFTQADLQGRNRVLKDLRINGAELCSDATNAQIMLVDTQTRQGVQFIREWGQDSNKTVLSYAWVKKSLTAGRPLFEEDQWGECLTRDDGAPIDSQRDNDAMNEDIANPLPTPRVTPDELARLRSKIVNTRQPSVSTNSQVEDLASAAPSPPHTTTVNGLPFSTDAMLSQPSSAGIPPVPGMNPFMFNTMPNMPNLSSPMMAFTAQAMQAMMANMLMNANTMPNQPNFSNDAFMLALQDSMRNHGVSSWQGPQVQTGVSTDGRLDQPVSPMREPPLPYPKAPPSSKEEDVPDTPSPLLEPPGSRRVSSPFEFLPGNSIEKGKSKERSPSPLYKRRKISSSSSKSIEKRSVGPSTTNGPSSQQKLFTKYGRALRFFVQIEIHHRFNLVSSIKKNGGMIVDSPNAADYAVLYPGNQNQRQNVFKKLLSAAQSAGVPAVQAKFVNECVAENELLESGPFVYRPESTGKRKRSKSAISVESESDDGEDPVEKRRLAKNARQAERRARIRIEKEKEQEEKLRMKPQSSTVSRASSTPRTKSTEKDSYPRATDGPRTPTPPQNSREICPTGYRFSQAENEFALQYAKILIDRDHTVSQSLVISVIHEKLPHHSLKSWRSHFNSIASEWDTWRKRSAIAYRKTQSMKETGEEILIAGPSPAFEKDQKFLDDLEDDVNTVVRFFVEGNDQDHSEDEHLVWKRLATLKPCKTEYSWEEFYDKNSQEVIRRYNRALKEAM